MASYRQVLYHIVICTKYRRKSLPLAESEELYRYMWGIIKNKNCILYRINGMEDHIHMLIDLHPSIALADFMRDLKTASSFWLKSHPAFPDFIGWSLGYGAFTYAFRDKNMIIGYIKKQRKHHGATRFVDEYRKLLWEHGVEIDERYFP